MPSIDPRASWTSVQTENKYPKWECLEVKYNDPSEAQNNRNIYVTLLESDGTPANGVKVWLDTGVPEDRSFQVTKNGGACDFPQTEDSNFAPSRGERGPYQVYVDSLPSDVVSGMGLPLKQHVRYFLKFKRNDGNVVPTPPPSGKLTDVELARLVTDAGFANREVAIAVILAESGGDPLAKNVNSPTSIDRGLWQISSKWHPEVADDCAYDPACSTQKAKRISNGGVDYTQWTAFTKGTYAQFIPRAQSALAALHGTDVPPERLAAYLLTRLQRAFKIAAEDLGKEI